MSAFAIRVKGPSREPEEGVEDDVKARLKQLQLGRLRRPTRKDGSLLEPKLPPDLTVLSDQKLGSLFTEFCAMAQYSKQVCSLFSVRRAVSSRRDRYERSRSRLMKQGTVDDKAAEVEVDPAVQKATVALLREEGTEMMTLALYESYIIGRDACSRELTRRQYLASERR